MTIKGLVEEAMARRAVLAGGPGALGDCWARGGLSTPPWVRASRCPAGTTASDAVLRALLPPVPRPRAASGPRPRLRPAYKRRHAARLRRISAPPEPTGRSPPHSLCRGLCCVGLGPRHCHCHYHCIRLLDHLLSRAPTMPSTVDYNIHLLDIILTRLDQDYQSLFGDKTG